MHDWPFFDFIVNDRYYAQDYRVLRIFAKHYSTGEPIPENLVKSLIGAKNMFAATELQRQVCFPMPKWINHSLCPLQMTH